MPTSNFIYNLDGAMTAAVGEMFSSIRRHNYTRLPVEITGTGGGSMALRYDSFGRRLHKTSAQTIFYRSGAHHPASDRTKELEKGDEIHHTLVELVNGAEIVYILTPAGQTILRRKDGYARIARDHLRSVRVELSSAAQITAHYSAYGKAIITGGQLRRAFAGYEPDAETGLYNANRRLYAPTLRLFVSVDPQLQNASPYPYCAADPFNLIDPTGGISASTIASIVMALVLVITIAANIASGGALSELFAPEAATETSSETSSGVTAAVTMYAKVGAAIGAAASVVSGGAELTVKAAQGEHITAWQAVRSMLIEPVIAAVAGGAGGAIGNVGLMATAVEGGPTIGTWLFALGMAVPAGIAAGGIASIANTALDGKIATRSGWEQIGIQMAIAAGEALILARAYLGPRPAVKRPLGEWGWIDTDPQRLIDPKSTGTSLRPGEKLAPVPPPGTVEMRPVRLVPLVRTTDPLAEEERQDVLPGGGAPGPFQGPFANPFGDPAEPYQDPPG